MSSGNGAVEQNAEAPARDEEETVEALTLDKAEKLVVGLEKKINENIRQRMKHKDPALFMSSEVSLDEHIKSLHVLATAPKFYPRLVKAEFVKTLLGLIIHENSDISVDTLDLLNDLIDPENLTEAELESHEFIQRLISKELNGLEIIVQNLSRLDEKEETDAQGVYYTLSIIENLVEHDAALVEPIFQTTTILEFIFKRIANQEGLDEIKLYCSEILSIMLQTSTKNQLFFASYKDVDAMDQMLVALSKYRKSDAGSSVEEEYVANMFEAICSALMVVQNQTRFMHLEGLELMLRMIKQRKVAYAFAIRAIKFAIGAQQHALGVELTSDDCIVVNTGYRLVQCGGLKTIFPLFMGRGLKRKRDPKTRHKADLDLIAVEENTVAVIASLATTLPLSSEEYKRFCEKFESHNMEKADRLVELHQKYSKRLRAKLGSAENEYEVAQHLESGLSRKEAMYLTRLSQGLEQLQQTSLIMAHLICAINGIYEHMDKQFKQTSTTSDSLSQIKGIATIVSEFRGALAKSEDEDSPLTVHNHVETLERRLSNLLVILEGE